MASEEAVSYRAEPGAATLPKNAKTKATGHGGVKTPPYKPAETGNFPANPTRWQASAGRHSCLPYKHPVPRTQAKYVSIRQPPTGRNHAAPTNPRQTPGKPYPGSCGGRLTCRSLFFCGRRPRHHNFSFLFFNFPFFLPRAA